MNLLRGFPAFRIIAILAVLVTLASLSTSATPARGATNPPSCTDSDGGLNYEVKGFVEGYGAKGYAYKRYDNCATGAYEGYLNESYCNGDLNWARRVQCPNGCTDGACTPLTPVCTDADGDGYSVEGGDCGPADCDDTNPAVNPGAAEVCGNGLDDNCNGLADAQEPSCAACTDADGDGYAVEGGACGAADCDDTNAAVNPGAAEVCGNGFDDNCNGLTDAQEPGCAVCTDTDGDGYSVEGGACGAADCDDANPAVNPGAAEVCDNGLDDNCNGLADLQEPACATCTDSDGGLNYYLQGTVTAGGAFTDACLDASQLHEYSCSSGGGVQSSTYACPSGCTNGACGAPNILVIGWDGTQKDHLLQCYNKQLPECSNGLPNLAALSVGRIFTSVTTSGRSETKPGWAQLFTGYNANVTGVYDNFNYRPIPLGYTVFEKVEDYFGANNVVTMFLSGKYEHTGGACIGDPTMESGQPAIEQKGQPWCLTKTRLDYFETNLKENVNTGNRALALLEANQDKLFFGLVNFWDPDSYGHYKGENSVEYSRAIIDGDYWLGRIIAKLQELGIYDDTLVYVVSDHGFDEDGRSHINSPFGIVASNDPQIMRDGDRKDFAPTLLARLGISTGAIGGAPAVDGFSLFSAAPVACIAEGGGFVGYPGAPACCSGLTLIDLSKPFGTVCMAATGGTGIQAGYCMQCGNGRCDYNLNENRCNCPADCRY